MTMKHAICIGLIATTVALMTVASSAGADDGVKIGVLTCNVSSGWGSSSDPART